MGLIRFLTGLLIAWVIIGALIYACRCKNQCPNWWGNDNTEVVTTQPMNSGVSEFKKPAFVLNDGSLFSVENKDGLRFPLSSSEPLIHASLGNDFNKIANYLKENPNKNLYLVGKYKGGEKTVGNFSNLGFARADRIANEFLKRGVSASQLFYGSQKAELPENAGFVYDAVDFSFTKPNVTNIIGLGNENLPGSKFVIKDGDNINLELDENVSFPKNSAEPTITEKVSQAFQQTADYLKKNRDRILQITGLYTRDEENSTKHPNLGSARAEAIKDELVRNGANRDQLSTTSRLVPKLPIKDEILTGGIEYSFKSVQEIEAYEKKLMDDIYSKISTIGSKNLYFDFGAKKISLTPDLANYIEDVKLYLSKKPNEKVRLIGHTDNVGDSASNLQYGQDRANFVKQYFINGGVRSNQIITESKGETQPIASNDTEAGRAKNRRVEISIK